MYTDHFSTEGLKCSEIAAILHASRRFQIQDLVVLCIQALKTHINDDTAVSLCEMGKDVDDLELRDKAIAYMCRLTLHLHNCLHTYLRINFKKFECALGTQRKFFTPQILWISAIKIWYSS